MIFALAILFISTCFTAYVLHRRFDPIDENFIMEPPVLFDESDDEAGSGLHASLPATGLDLGRQDTGIGGGDVWPHAVIRTGLSLL